MLPHRLGQSKLYCELFTIWYQQYIELTNYYLRIWRLI